ncbi:DNA-processing protein DprA [Peptostreptococcus faecalis]|uniref:DNA-processing protein DprA n=1 Tax=Peptostreptococcus faecalis TaxID=2045015 RepID=UPI000C7A666E|nr:DNA-processing protein DprA [Peptostreptococcus faecalis]
MNKDFYIWANLVAEITPIEMKKIRNKYSNYKEQESVNIANKIKGDLDLEKRTITKIRNNFFCQESINNLKKEMKDRCIKYITIEDKEYPELLKMIYDPPYILYYIGNIETLKSEMIIAIVGSRKVTEYGRHATRIFSKSLASKGVVIISGMAKGVDSLAHIHCMEEGTPTIAVLGTAIDKIYPKSNIKLVNEIVEKGGVVISEHGIDKITQPYHFAMRNRIISGISKGVIVTEAEEKSGALITVDCALQQNRNVYSVPGSIFSSMSRGCNNIINQGAKPVQNIDDIIEEFSEYFYQKEKIYKNNNNEFCKKTGNSGGSCDNIFLDDNKDINLLSEEGMILKILSSKGALNIDQISLISGFEIKDVIYYIGKLNMMDLILDLGSNTYAPNTSK